VLTARIALKETNYLDDVRVLPPMCSVPEVALHKAATLPQPSDLPIDGCQPYHQIRLGLAILEPEQAAHTALEQVEVLSAA
jgi:hypothetical protein